MTPCSRIGWTCLLLAALFAVLACNDDPEPPPLSAEFVGTWSTGCFNENPGFSSDEIEVVTFTLTSLTIQVTNFTSKDVSCSTGGTPAPAETASYAIAGPISATLDVSSVTAKALNLTFAGLGSTYTIGYVDTAATPDVLYLGDEIATPGLDGTAPDKRPNVLQHWKPRNKQ